MEDPDDSVGMFEHRQQLEKDLAYYRTENELLRANANSSAQRQVNYGIKLLAERLCEIAVDDDHYGDLYAGDVWDAAASFGVEIDKKWRSED